MPKLTSVESRYWIDSCPVDLAIACVVALCAMVLTAPLVFHYAMQYFVTHRVLDTREHRSAAAFLTVLLSVFAGVSSAALTLTARLFLRLYRNPL